MMEVDYAITWIIVMFNFAVFVSVILNAGPHLHLCSKHTEGK